MKNPLISQSENFKREADLLLRKSKLLELLKPYGRIRFTGAYRLNLMLNGDIDIHVINPKITKESAIEALNKLINQGFFRGYLFYDWVKFRKAEFPKGYYIGLKMKFNQRKWKIDIWFLKKDDPKEVKLIDLVEKNLNDKNKLAILKIKHLRNRENFEVSSFKIYRTVIKKGITEPKNFLRFIKQQNN